MKKILILTVVFFCSGCSTFSEVVSYTQQNHLLIDIAAKRAIANYIEAPENYEDMMKRAEKVQSAIEHAQKLIEGNPKANANTLLMVVRSKIDIELMSISDQMLVEDIFKIIELNIMKSEKSGFIEQNELITIRNLLRTILHTAKVFL